MRDEEQGGHRWERVRGKHSRRCAPATGGVPMPKMRCIDRKVRAESRSSEQTNLGSSTCHGLPCGFAVITNRNPHSRRTGGISCQLHFSQIPGHTARSHYMGGGGVHMDTTAHRCAEAALSRQRRSSGSCCSYTRSTEDSCSNAGMRATLRRLKQWDADAAEQGDTPHREW